MFYIIRISGTNEYVSKINPDDDRCVPPGSVKLVLGRQHSQVKRYPTRAAAEAAAEAVGDIEGFPTWIEEHA